MGESGAFVVHYNERKLNSLLLIVTSLGTTAQNVFENMFALFNFIFFFIFITKLIFFFS